MSILLPFRSLCILVTLALGPAVGWAQPVVPPAESADDATRLQALLSGEGELRLAGRSLDRDRLAPIYQTHRYLPLWDAERQAALLKALDGAAAQGLDPADYAIPAAGAVERDLLLTDTFLRYAAALAKGRVAPSEVESDWLIPAPTFDGAGLVDLALSGDVGSVLSDLPPKNPAYLRLIAALQQYRQLAEAAPWQPLPLGLALASGATGNDVRLLRQRLAAEGFIAAGDSAVFDNELEKAVKRFQSVRGLPIDGSVGGGTLAALNVPASERVKEISINLDRWRSLPRTLPAGRVEVNVAAASATLYRNDEPVLSMKAIVGAPEHPTPVLGARIVAILFNPPWIIPRSIIAKEIRPAIRRDPDYLTKQGYVYVERHGRLELEQPPGPKNALGRLKFEMPNPDDVYLHDTPGRNLFRKARRTFSHGCIRLENPRGLASALLAPLPDGEPAAIDHAIDIGATHRLALPHLEPVYLLYWTAFVDADGTVEFRDDVYGRDGRLMAALAARDTARPAAPASRTESGKI